MNNININKILKIIITFLFVFLILFVFFLFLNINENNKQQKETQILKEELKQETNIEIKSLTESNFLSKIEKEEVIIIDVRTKEEFDDFHLEGAINIDYYKSNFRSELDKLDRNKTYMIYCRSGNRTGDTLRIMRAMGFKSVFDLSGGIASCSSC